MILEDCKDASTKKVLDNPAIRRMPPAKGIKPNWCSTRDNKIRNWPEGKAPVPDWKEAHVNAFQEHAPEPASEEIVLDVDLEDLELTEEDKIINANAA